MAEVLLDSITFRPEISDLLSQLRIKPGSSQANEFGVLLAEALVLARPKAGYCIRNVEAHETQHVYIQGVVLNSKLLAHQTRPGGVIFPFLATCGEELEAWGKGFNDIVLRFWADAIQETALDWAMSALNQHFENQIRQNTGWVCLNPGSLEDWPITEQKPLFKLLNGLDKQIGVRLNDSYLMTPIKTISGIRFESPFSLDNCMVCTNLKCKGRKSPYEEDLLKKMTSADDT